MIPNLGKFQIIFIGSSINNKNIFIAENKHIKNNNEVKLLGITIDHKLTCTKYINNLCNTASKTFRTLRKIRKFLSREQTKRLSEAYIMSTFKYCYLIWVFYGKTKNKSINKIHKRTLRLIYDTEDATFEDLLGRDKSRTIHEDNLHKLLVEIYKSIH